MSLDDIKAGFVNRIEDRGGNLTNATPDVIDILSIDDGTCSLETTLLVAVTSNIVEAPATAVGLDDRVVDKIGGKMDVMVSRLGAGIS